MKNITLTPISKDNKNNTSLEDYNREKEFEKAGLDLAWDSDIRNRAVSGDLFGFYHHSKGIVEIHEIKAVLPATKRDSNWTIVEHAYRNVLVLGPKIMTIAIDSLENDILDGKPYYPMQGTNTRKIK